VRVYWYAWAHPWIRLERRRFRASNRGTSIAIMSRRAYTIEMMALALRRSGGRFPSAALTISLPDRVSPST